jgi:hypothetical protein
LLARGGLALALLLLFLLVDRARHHLDEGAIHLHQLFVAPRLLRIYIVPPKNPLSLSGANFSQPTTALSK